jgi:hypothetical protein
MNFDSLDTDGELKEETVINRVAAEKSREYMLKSKREIIVELGEVDGCEEALGSDAAEEHEAVKSSDIFSQVQDRTEKQMNQPAFSALCGSNIDDDDDDDDEFEDVPISISENNPEVRVHSIELGILSYNTEAGRKRRR